MSSLNAKMQKKKILLPEEVNIQTSRDNLLEGMMITMDGFGEEDSEIPKVVKIADGGSDEGKDEETAEEEEAYETKPANVAEDDTPKEDFFDAKEDTEEEKFGAIKGMTEVVEDEEDEFHLHARRLSVYAQNFTADIEEINKEPIKKEESELEDEKDTAEAEEEEKPEVKQDESAARMKRLTKMLSIDQSAKIALSLEAFRASKDLTAGGRLTINLSKLQLPTTLYNKEAKYPKATKRSMYYDVNTRADSEPDIMDFFDLEKSDGFVLPDYCEKEEEAEEVLSVEEEKPIPLERGPYYQRYDESIENISRHKIRNNILQKKVIMYLKRRKVEFFLKDSTFHLDQQLKYQNKLDMYQQFMELGISQKQAMTEELEVLKQKSALHYVKVEKLFKTMQTKEANVGYGLIYTKTGATISDKVIERLLKRQKTQMDQVTTMRLKYLKLKGMVQEKLDAIEKTDELENNLRLADYEQLKVDNRNYYDKIEEREEELVRLRTKCQNTIQILAHMREKTEALETDIDDLRDEQTNAEEMADELRANVASLRHQRDKYRKLIVDIKMESGLLIYPDLLIDMEDAQKDIQKVNEELESCREEFRSKSTQIRILRKNIERLTDALEKKKRLKGKSSWTTLQTASIIIKPTKSNKALREGPTVYNRRPTLQVPTIKQEAFKDLIKIIPNPKILNKRK